MRNRRWLAAVGAALFGFVIAGAAPAQPPAGTVSSPAGPAPVAPAFFTANVLPVFKSRCTGCHGAEVQRGGLRLDDREAALKGSASGPVIVPGSADKSRLYQMVKAKRMPLDDELSILELENLKDWIDGGAPWPAKRTIPGLIPDPRIDEYRVALRNGDAAAISRLTASPGFAKARDKNGATALHHAAVYGDAARVRALIDAGADVNAVNLDGITPLIWGVRNEAVARLLIERGADVNAQADSGATPLMSAVGLVRNTSTLALLLEKGAKPAQPPALGASVGASGNLDNIKLIFPKVLPVSGPPAAAATANMAVTRCWACVDYMVSQGARGATLNGALTVAANYDDIGKVKQLLALGATLDGKGPQDAPLMVAAVMSDYQALEKVNLLIAAGADVNAADAHGRTPLYFARRLHPEIVPVLTAKGAK